MISAFYRIDESVCHFGGVRVPVAVVAEPRESGYPFINSVVAHKIGSQHIDKFAVGNISVENEPVKSAKRVSEGGYTGKEYILRAVLQAVRGIIAYLVTGADKKDILKKTFWGPVDPEVPASILQFHPDVTLVCDEAAYPF